MPPAHCKLGTYADESGPLSAADRAALARALPSPAVPATALSRALGAIGSPVGTTTVKDHRAGRCACAREDTA